MTDGNYWMASQVLAAAVSLIVLLMVWRYCTTQFGLFIGLAFGWLPGGLIGLFVGALTLAFWGAIASLAALGIAALLLSIAFIRASLICRRMGAGASAFWRRRCRSADANLASYSTKKSSVGALSSPTKKTEPSDISM